MGSVINVGRIILATLLFFQFIILSLRYSRDRNLKEFVFFTLIILFIGFKGLFSYILVLNIYTSLILINFCGNYLFILTPIKKGVIWNTVCLVLGLIIFILFRLDFHKIILFPFFYFTSMLLLLILPLMLLNILSVQSQKPIFRFFMLVMVLYVSAKTWDMLATFLGFINLEITLWMSIVMILGVAYLLFQEGYLLGHGLHGFQRQIVEQELNIQKAMAKLFQTESSLIMQDRLVACGILAAGAAHEFKNILSNIRLTTQYGLQVEEEREEILKAILLNTDQGFESVNRYLDMIVLKSDEEKYPLNLPQDIDSILKLMKVSLRKEGVSLIITTINTFTIKMGKGEFLQVIMNLIRNAVSAVKDNLDGNRQIEVFFKRDENFNIIEIQDNGCGIPKNMKHKLFEPNTSGKESTGLGLYLSKMLIKRNFGNIEYESLKKGTLFRMLFTKTEG